jgi:hypothetical protein
MARTKQVRPPQPHVTPEEYLRIRSKMCMMSAARQPVIFKKQKRKPARRTRRKIRDIDLTKELCDLERDIALHSTPEASNPPSCTKDGRTLAHDEQLGTQRRDEPGE